MTSRSATAKCVRTLPWILPAAAAGVLLVGVPTLTTEPPPYSPMELDVARTLLVATMDDAPSDEVLIERVADHGPAVADVLFDMLLRREVPDLAGPGFSALSPHQEELVLAALTAAGRSAALDRAEELIEDASSPREVAAGLLAVGAVGKTAEIDLLLEVRAGIDGTVHPDVIDAFERALQALLVRDEQALTRLGSCWRDADPLLLPALVSAVGESGDPRGTEVLGDLLPWHTELASDVASQVRRLGPHPDPRVNASLADSLRSCLDDGRQSPDTVRAAVLALGELDDFQAVPMLIEYLDDESRGLRQNALWALREMSRLRLGEEASFWVEWYERELAWFTEVRPEHRLQLTTGADEALLLRALGSYVGRRLFRHELAADVSEVLYRNAPADLRVLACDVLLDLGSERAIPGLAYALADVDGEVRASAHRALKEITGLDLPAEVSLWHEALELHLP